MPGKACWGMETPDLKIIFQISKELAQDMLYAAQFPHRCKKAGGFTRQPFAVISNSRRFAVQASRRRRKPNAIKPKNSSSMRLGSGVMTITP